MLLSLYLLCSGATFVAVYRVWIEDDKITTSTDPLTVGVAFVLACIFAFCWPVFLLSMVVYKLIK